jgi:hypothetical protein
MKKCSYCGKEYGDEVAFCSIDKQPIGVEPASGTPGRRAIQNLQRISKSPYTIAATIVLLIVIAATSDNFPLGDRVMTIILYPGLVLGLLLGGTYFTVILVSWFAWLAVIFPPLWFWLRHRKAKNKSPGPNLTAEDRQKGFVTLVRCATLPAADMIVSRLQVAGIEAFIPDQSLTQTMGGDLNALGSVRVQIAPNDLEAARELLSDIHDAA